jgi:hypothetical protein
MTEVAPTQLRRIFISHSGKDVDFARQLDTTLLTNGVETFLAERDIRVGDSIPERIYGEMNVATGLVYIVSAHSISSSWVQEELSIAKMKEKKSLGFRVFPVLIDDIELPVGILHVKYADFRSWRSSQAYRKACLELIDAMGVSPRLVGRDDLRWYATRAESLRDLDQTLRSAVATLTGALEATQGFTGYHLRPGQSRDESLELLPHFAPTKYVFEAGIVSALESLYSMIDPSIASDRLRTLRESAGAAAMAGRAFIGTKMYGEWHRVEDFWMRLKRPSAMLTALRTELEITLLSTVPLE